MIADNTFTAINQSINQSIKFILRGAVVQSPSENRIPDRTVRQRRRLVSKVDDHLYALPTRMSWVDYGSWKLLLCIAVTVENCSIWSALRLWKPWRQSLFSSVVWREDCCPSSVGYMPADVRRWYRRGNLAGDGWALYRCVFGIYVYSQSFNFQEQKWSISSVMISAKANILLVFWFDLCKENKEIHN